jgi:hypothetical protein
MIALDRTAQGALFIRDHGGGYWPPESSQVLSYRDGPDGPPLAAIQFYRHMGPNVYSSFASTMQVFPRSLLLAAGRYAFLDLGCQRLTYEISSANLKSIQFVETLGAYREATLQDGCSDGDLHIYCLRPDRCELWRKLYGRRRRST